MFGRVLISPSDLIPLAILDSWKRVPIGDRAPVGPLASLSFEELAAQLGVAPVENFGASAEDESVEEAPGRGELA